MIDAHSLDDDGDSAKRDAEAIQRMMQQSRRLELTDAVRLTKKNKRTLTEGYRRHPNAREKEPSELASPRLLIAASRDKLVNLFCSLLQPLYNFETSKVGIEISRWDKRTSEEECGWNDGIDGYIVDRILTQESDAVLHDGALNICVQEVPTIGEMPPVDKNTVVLQPNKLIVISHKELFHFTSILGRYHLSRNDELIIIDEIQKYTLHSEKRHAAAFERLYEDLDCVNNSDDEDDD